MIISKDDCYYLGYLSKAQGFKGGLIGFFDVDDTGDYKKLESILVDLNGTLTPFFIDEINLKDKNFVFLKLEGVDDQNRATNLAGSDMYLPLSRLPKLEEGAYYLHQLEGMEVHDQSKGMIGTVEKLFYYNQNTTLQIIDGKDEILIPLNEVFVKKVSVADNRIDIDVPEELLSVNKS